LTIRRNRETFGDEKLGDADTHVPNRQDADFDALLVACRHYFFNSFTVEEEEEEEEERTSGLWILKGAMSSAGYSLDRNNADK
jgi:hypothetical protein